ncbi:MAG: HAD-IA family hydrolase [Gammaproteobacteria bacterium]|nr:HAD-IA family hydrolase [Gammaproteobacteria bacterium]
MMNSNQQVTIIVFFDWDNTIMASADFLRQVHEETAKRLTQDSIFLKCKIPAIATKRRDEILKELFGEENYIMALQVFQQVYDEIFKPETLQMLSGAKELIEKLNAANIPVAIISNYTETGIKEHLTLRRINYSKIVIIGADTLPQSKPDIAPGLLALEKLNINPQQQKIKALMIGDGINSDMLFAQNMNTYLNKFNSSCSGILFNSLLNSDPIFTAQEIETFMNSNENKNNITVAYGYGRLFTSVRDIINPYHIKHRDLASPSKNHFLLQ